MCGGIHMSVCLGVCSIYYKNLNTQDISKTVLNLKKSESFDNIFFLHWFDFTLNNWPR